MTNKDKLKAYQILNKEYKDTWESTCIGLCHHLKVLKEDKKISLSDFIFLSDEVQSEIKRLGRICTIAPLWDEDPRLNFINKRMNYYNQILKNNEKI